ncbi:hypothetical protein LOD99_14069 [Oopsacas minuta]|uniref:Uncharacterized protein n=1 Tax=Oopsacas minuta TaxID=111878 RepID=A0AAV7KHW8_9METZ|nr:hypothetical protein LOD99_14069 [Oopsacas minuta]
MKPSDFIRIQRLNTDEYLNEQRQEKQSGQPVQPPITELLDITRASYQRDSSLPIGKPLFDVFPSELCFHKYKAYQLYKIPLRLKNLDHVVRQVRVVCEASEYFKLLPPSVSRQKDKSMKVKKIEGETSLSSNSGLRVAPGMEVVYTIEFRPDQQADYTHEVTVMTEREKLVIPVLATGARALLDFPDWVELGEAPVRHETSKTLLVRNLGEREGRFVLRCTPSDVFSASPTEASLDIQQCSQVTVKMMSTKAGTQEGSMSVQLDTGEEISVQLRGSTYNASVRLEKRDVKLPDTFIGLGARQEVKLINNSNVLVNFCWKTWGSESEEEAERCNATAMLATRQNMAEDLFRDESERDERIRDRVSILTRSFKMRQTQLTMDRFHFEDRTVSIDPLEGEVWPQTETLISVRFHPIADEDYSCTAYCEVTGRESRLPLLISGRGLGPHLELSLDQLSIGKVCLSTSHVYELLIRNKGYISGEYSLIRPSVQTPIASSFNFTPSQGVLQPGDVQTIQISFTYPQEHHNKFSEEFVWEVTGASVPLKLTITGTVTKPTFILSHDELNFGIIAYGFPVELALTITNTSSVQIDCKLHVPQDGEVTQEMTSLRHPCIYALKEFIITPDICNIPSGQEHAVTVEFSPQSVKNYNVRMLLDIVGVSDAVCSIPILAHVRVPTIIPSTRMLNCSNCFVGHTFCRELQLINDDDFAACYSLEEVIDPSDILLVKSTEVEGVVPANSTVTLPIELQANCIGDNTSFVSIVILGSEQVIRLEVRFVGEGPVVHVTPTTINWGKLSVFVPNTFTVSMSNQAPIPAEYTCCLATDTPVFQVDPVKGSIPAHASQELRITANLNDSIVFANKLVIKFNHDVMYYVGLEAKGSGVTILSDPPLLPKMDFGHFYSSGVFKKTFLLTNSGTRTHILTWNVASHAAQRNKKLSNLRLDPLDMANSAKLVSSRPLSEVPPSVKLIPPEIYLTPDSSSELVLEMYSETPRLVTETLLCYALIGKLTTKHLLLESEISIEFIQPLIRFSADQLSFSCIQDHKGYLEAKSTSLSLVNISSLPLHTSLMLPPPFSFITDNSLTSNLELYFDTHQTQEVTILFDPNTRDGKHSYSVEDEMTVRYAEHPSKDSFPILGSVHYPNLSFSTQTIDFGTILNDTDTLYKVRIQNTSPIQVKFNWCFQEPEQHALGQHDVTRNADNIQVFSDSLDNDTFAIHSPTKPQFQPWGDKYDPFGVAPINQLFDILPIHATLQPDEVMDVEFSFYGRANSSISAEAICSLEQGPEYTLQLRGRASSMKYTLSRNVLKLPYCHYAKPSLLEITLYNIGLVEFSVDLSDSNWPSLSPHNNKSPFTLAFEPDNFSLAAGAHKVISIAFTPGVPGSFRAEFYINIAHFQPEAIEISGEAVFPNFRFSLPRPTVDIMLLRDHARAPSRGHSGHESPHLRDTEDQETKIEQDIVRKLALSVPGSYDTIDSSEVTASKPARAVLPAYELDFSYVILGRIVTHTLSLFNPTNFTISVNLSQVALLKKSGFTFASSKLTDIPPAGVLELEVVFDPASVGLPCGEFSITSRFMVTEGPEVPLVLTGEVTLPDLVLSATELDFEDVIVSRCKIVTLQLHNPTPVSCTWQPEVPLHPKKINKFIPLHLKKKTQPPKHAPHFEVIPARGCVEAGQRLNVKIKFLPSEQFKYSRNIIFHLKDNPASYHILHARGNGVEQQLQFSTTVLEFGPVLPLSQGESKEVTITNLTPFPCEIYSLEFDSVYLDEESVLRTLGDYDKFGQLMLPPRSAGDKLPQEVNDWWEVKRLELEALNAPLQSPVEIPITQTKSNFTSAISNDLFQYENASYLERVSPASIDTSSIAVMLENLKKSPNMAAVARHIGISAQENMKHFEQGIVFILMGGPYSGKSTQAQLLSEKYCIPIIELDNVIIEAIQHGILPAAHKAREMCVQAIQSVNDIETEVQEQQDTSKLPKDKLDTVPMVSTGVEFEIRDATSEEAILLSSTLLSEEDVVEIIMSRIHQNDCFPGMIFDSLDCSFLSDESQAARTVLKSIRHRELFYFVNLEFNPDAACEAKQLKEEEEAAKERELLASVSPVIDPALLEPELELSDEEGYELLSQERKDAINRAIAKKWRAEREKKRLEEEEKRRELELLEQKRLMEEEAKKKGGKKGQKSTFANLKDGSNENFKGLKQTPSVTSMAQQQQTPAPAPTSPTPSRPGSVTSGSTIRRAAKNAAIISKVIGLVDQAPPPEEDEMSALYTKYERHLLLARGVIELWDPVKMDTYSPPEPVQLQQDHEPVVSRQQKLKKDLKFKDLPSTGIDPMAELETLLQSKPENIGLSYYAINGVGTKEYIHVQICGLPCVPTPTELLDRLGIGPAGPRIPPPFELSMFNYPVYRQRPIPPEMERRFCFVALHPDDPNAIDTKLEEEELKKQQAISPIQEEEKDPPPQPPSRKSTISRASQESQKKTRDVSGKKSQRKKSQKEPRSSTPKGSVPLDESAASDDVITTPDTLVPVGPKKLIKHRWVIPGHGSTTLGIQFMSNEVGNYDETLHFEVMGTSRRYQLYCRGLCAVPGICTDPKVMFPACKPSRKIGEIIKKRFVLSQDLYDFGPLSYFRSRERRFQSKHPENMEDLTILNDSPLQANVTFKFKDDNNATTFLLEPPNLLLNPGEKGKLSIWAYPKHPHEFNDTLMCFIENNPKPVVFKIRAVCVKPELKLDRNDFKFDKVLLHRKESRQIFLKNPTLLPVSWKLATGERSVISESDADIYSFNQEQGIVEPLSEFALVCYFRSPRPTVIKKTLRLEVYSLDSTIGLLTNENLTLQVEAYDVALDISFPKGSEGKLEFHPVRIFEEAKQVCHVKNKGKYELHFQFDYETIKGVSMRNCFEVYPAKGALQAGEKAQPTTVIFNPKQAFNLSNVAAMRCHVIDPTYGEVIASIPIHVEAQAVFSEFKVHPVNDINFGPVVMNASGKQQKTLTIENTGLFEFRYNIIKLSSFMSRRGTGASRKAARSRLDDAPQGRTSAKALPKGKTGPSEQRLEGPQAPVKQNFGAFTLNPAHAIVQPGQSQQVTIECHPENIGFHEEKLIIDVTDKNPNPNPNPVTKSADMQYSLLCEACVPSIEKSIASICEEHRICKSLKSLSVGSLLLRGAGAGIFFEAEKIFRFNTIVVGRQMEARFRIQNTSKVPCDVICMPKGIGSPFKQMKGMGEVFEIEPSKLHLLPHSHKFVTVTFRPQAIQHYHYNFSVSLEGPGHLSRGMGLNFDLQGEGSLPQVAVLQPAATDRNGKPVMIFKRLVVGKTQYLPLVLSNIGSMSAMMSLKLDEQANEFTIKPIILPTSSPQPDPDLSVSGYGQHLVNLDPNDQCTFELCYSPRKPGEHCYSIILQVQDNPYEQTKILLLAESYVDEIIIDNIRGAHYSPQLAMSLDSSLLKPINENHLDFGNSAVGEEKQLVFCITNNSQDVFKIHFESILPSLTFTPSSAHLHGNRSKDILVTFKSDKAINHNRASVICKLQKIQLIDKDSIDWDDRMKVTRWVPVYTGKHQEEDRMSIVSGTHPPPTASGHSSTVHLIGHVPPSPIAVKRKRITEIEKEPAYQDIPSSSRQIELFITALADLPRVEPSVTDIHLKDTMMFQSRKYSFELRNVSQVTAHFEWLLESDMYPEPVPFEQDQTERFENLYLSITPATGDIPPQEHVNITLKFSPADVIQLQAKLLARIKNLPPASSDIEITLLGESVMPYCHFDLPTVSYSQLANTLDIKTSTTSYTTPLNSATRVLTFETCGVGVTVSRSFHVINPTNLTYDFVWQPDLKEDVRKPFICLTKTGSITGGKKFEMTFEFLPSTADYEECLWKFTIPSLALMVPLLFIGYIVEPKVLLDRTYLHFKPQLVSQVCRESVYMINDEDRAYTFSVREASCHMPGHQASLTVNPMSGTILPHSRLPILITLPLKKQAEHSFNLKIDVKHNAIPLLLNVKASSFLTDATLKVRNFAGDEIEIFPDTKQKSDQTCTNFGSVQLNEKSLHTVILNNNGLFAFDYFWRLSERCFKAGGSESEAGQLVNINPQSGRLEPHTSCQADLSVCPTVPINLKGCSLECHIKEGPTFSLGLLGKGIKPSLYFSFTKFNFGMCFLYHPALPSNVTTLTITNNEDNQISLDILPFTLPHVIINFTSIILSPGASTEAEITFLPHEAVKYRDVIEFNINGITKQPIEILGQGTELKLEVTKPQKKLVNFGVIRVNEKADKTVTITNLGAAAVEFSLQLKGGTPPEVLKFTPSENISLKPNGDSIIINLTFCPTSRIEQFTDEVQFEVLRLIKPLFMVSGCCQDVDIRLATSHIPFGQVCLNSKSSRQLQLSNKGDIGAHFKWDLEAFKPDFTITPVQGYISPKLEVIFSIEFYPQAINSDIRYEHIKCELEGTKPQYLTLTGMCSDIQPKESIQFTTPVRTSESKHLSISVPRITNTIHLKPSIDGNSWSGPELLTIEPNQTKNYTITYHPLEMTSDHRKHVGSIFFPLPEGQGLLYNLTGVSEAPKPIDSRSVDVPSKLRHTEYLPVANWLTTNQRFKVFRDILKPDRPDISLSIQGQDYIDVPGNSKREYQLHFHAFKVGTTYMRVTFKNEDTGEYCFYLLTFKAVSAGTIDVINLDTTVRQRVIHTIRVHNPLPIQVSISTNCSLYDISLPAQFLVGAQSEGTCTFEYLPLKSGEISGEISLTSADLGIYHYTLHLTAHPSPPEPPVTIAGYLGSTTVQPVSFISYAKANRIEYICKVDHSDFHVERTVLAASAAGGIEVQIDVNFEPSSLGTINAILSVSSQSGGEYVIPIVGECNLPNPQGPYVIKAGHSVNIPFKNVFPVAVNYIYSLDNPAFQFRAVDQLKPKKSYTITVTFDPKQADSYGTNTGKLIAKCPPGNGDSLSSISWIFYLKGII